MKKAFLAVLVTFFVFSLASAQDVQIPVDQVDNKLEVKLKDSDELLQFQKMEIHEVFGNFVYFFERMDGTIASYGFMDVDYFKETDFSGADILEQEESNEELAAGHRMNELEVLKPKGDDQSKSDTAVTESGNFTTVKTGRVSEHEKKVEDIEINIDLKPGRIGPRNVRSRSQSARSTGRSVTYKFEYDSSGRVYRTTREYN